MATSGSTSIAATSQDTLKFSWSLTSQSVANNTSTISWKLQLIASSSGYISSTASKDWSVTVNGTKYSGTNTIGIANNATKTLASGTTTISHNSDGTKTFSYSFSQELAITWSGSYIGTKSGSGSGTLTTIPRGSVLGTISNFTLGNSIDIPITKYSSSFTDTLVISLSGTTIKTISGITSGYDVSFTSAELTTIYSKIPNGTTGTFTFTLTTKSGSTTIGTSTKTATGTIPSSVKPTISSVTISEGNTEVVPSSWGVYVKNKSKLKFVISASAGSGSSISSIKTTINGSTYTGSTITTNLINTSGTLTATIVVTDNRNRSTSTTQNILIVDYDIPYITTLNAFRCDEDGNALESGTYAKVSLVGGVYSIDGKNTATYSIKYKKTTDTEYQTYTFDVADSTIDSDVILSDIETSSSYNIMAVITDYFTTLNENMNPPLMSVYRTLNFLPGGHGGAIGKMAEEEDVWDIALATKLTGGLEPIFLEADTDLNDVLTPNFYTGQNISHYNYGNCPLASGTFYLEVVSMGADGQVRQTITSCSKDNSVSYERFYYQGSWGEWRNCFIGEEVIYDNSTGSGETITLTTSVAQYQYIEIFYYYGGSYYSSVKVYNPNGKKVNMVGAMVNQSTSAVYLSATTATISGATITPNYYGEYTITSNSFAFTENRIFITRVVGYR